MRVALPLVALIFTTAAAPYAPAVVPQPLLAVPASTAPALPPALERKPLISVQTAGAEERQPGLERVDAVPDHPSFSMRLLEGPPGPGEAVCRDRVHEVREERGLPKLDDKSANADEPLFIAAVDKRIDGCSMLVMRNDTSDVRPLPAMPEHSPRLQRIPGG